MNYFEDKNYEKLSVISHELEKGLYENCCFTNCDFSSADLTGYNFTDCSFQDCNFSMSKLIDTQLNNITFTSCKLLGVKFEQCNPFLFSIGFYDCQIQLTSFYSVKLKNTVLRNCKVIESDFTEADLTATVFDNCDLLNSTFENTTLIKTDFSTSYNFTIHPEANKLGKTKFNRQTLDGLLYRYDIVIS